MSESPKQEIKLFYCYAWEDKGLRDELEKHLAWLKRRYQLTNWHDREILPGEEWEQAIDTHLNTAHLILLLISPDFMASDYCYGKEMKRALERHQVGTCRVLPILLRPTYWEEAPFSSIQLLPTDARPITRWPDRDEALQDVVAGISRTIKDLLVFFKTKEEWLEEGNRFYSLNCYEEALVSYEKAIRLDPNFIFAHYNKGLALTELKRYEEALAAYEETIQLDSKYTNAFTRKGSILIELKRYEEALVTYNHLIQLGSNNAAAYSDRGNILHCLKRYEEALVSFDRAIQLDPKLTDAYINKGATLNELERDEEAFMAFDQAFQIDPN